MRRWPLLAAATLALIPTGAWACAVCVGGAGETANAGFYWSALLLTALPFAVIAAVGAWVARRGRAADCISELGRLPHGRPAAPAALVGAMRGQGNGRPLVERARYPGQGLRRRWEGCLACAHTLTAHAQPRGSCQIARCGCRGFDWADEGQVVGSFRLCLRWLWATRARPASPETVSDWRGTLAALRAITDLLGPSRAARILSEEKERWRTETGWVPRTPAFVRSGGSPRGERAT